MSTSSPSDVTQLRYQRVHCAWSDVEGVQLAPNRRHAILCAPHHVGVLSLSAPTSFSSTRACDDAQCSSTMTTSTSAAAVSANRHERPARGALRVWPQPHRRITASCWVSEGFSQPRTQSLSQQDPHRTANAVIALGDAASVLTICRLTEPTNDADSARDERGRESFVPPSITPAAVRTVFIGDSWSSPGRVESERCDLKSDALSHWIAHELLRKVAAAPSSTAKRHCNTDGNTEKEEEVSRSVKTEEKEDDSDDDEAAEGLMKRASHTDCVTSLREPHVAAHSPHVPLPPNAITCVLPTSTDADYVLCQRFAESFFASSSSSSYSSSSAPMHSAAAAGGGGGGVVATTTGSSSGYENAIGTTVWMTSLVQETAWPLCLRATPPKGCALLSSAATAPWPSVRREENTNDAIGRMTRLHSPWPDDAHATEMCVRLFDVRTSQRVVASAHANASFAAMSSAPQFAAAYSQWVTLHHAMTLAPMVSFPFGNSTSHAAYSSSPFTTSSSSHAAASAQYEVVAMYRADGALRIGERNASTPSTFSSPSHGVGRATPEAAYRLCGCEGSQASGFEYVLTLREQCPPQQRAPLWMMCFDARQALLPLWCVPLSTPRNETKEEEEEEEEDAESGRCRGEGEHDHDSRHRYVSVKREADSEADSVREKQRQQEQPGDNEDGMYCDRTAEETTKSDGARKADLRRANELPMVCVEPLSDSAAAVLICDGPSSHHSLDSHANTTHSPFTQARFLPTLYAVRYLNTLTEGEEYSDDTSEDETHARKKTVTETTGRTHDGCDVGSRVATTVSAYGGQATHRRGYAEAYSQTLHPLTASHLAADGTQSHVSSSPAESECVRGMAFVDGVLRVITTPSPVVKR